MSNQNDNNTQVLDPETVNSQEQAQTEVIADETEATTEVPVVKTKKELKKERKEIKKHKKAVKKEAKRHSAKATKAQKFFITLLTLIVVVCMVWCSCMAITITKNMMDSSSASTGTVNEDNANAANDTNNSSSNANSSASANSSSNNSASSDSSASSSASSDDTAASTENSSDASSEGTDSSAAATGDLSTKESVVEYYKTAHAKVLSEAASVTRTYDNVTNYNGVVEVGGNSTLAGIAKTLMDTFMSENTEAVQHVGSAEIAASFPPTGEGGCSGLTADMISDYSCKEENGNYIITLTLDSSEENPDDGSKGKNLVDIVEESQITDAAGSFVSLSGYQNQCIGSTVTATIEKETGKMTHLSIYNPTYMCFGKATAMSIITVENCKLGLLYEQEWTVEW